MGYVDNTTIYDFIPRPLLRSKVMESLNKDLAAINLRCLKSHMRLNPKKTKSIAISQSLTIAPSYGNFAFGEAELELKSAYSWSSL